MRHFFANSFTGPALAVLGIYLAVVSYMNWDALAAESVQLGLPSANTLPGLASLIAMTVGFAGLLCVMFRRQR